MPVGFINLLAIFIVCTMLALGESLHPCGHKIRLAVRLTQSTLVATVLLQLALVFLMLPSN